MCQNLLINDHNFRRTIHDDFILLALSASRWSTRPRRMQRTPLSLYAHNIIAQCNLLKFEVSRSTRYIHYVRSNYQAYRQETSPNVATGDLQPVWFLIALRQHRTELYRNWYIVESQNKYRYRLDFSVAQRQRIYLQTHTSW